MLSELV